MRSVLPLALCLLAACAAVTTRATPLTAPEQLRSAVEDWFEEDLKLNPLRATYIGDHRFDGELGNPASLAHEAKARASWEKALARVEAIDPAQLSPADQLTREIFLHNARTALAGLQFPERLVPLNQMGNLVLELARFGSGEGAQPLQTVAEHELWLQRAAGFPAWADSAIAAMREGQAKGITLPKIAMERVLVQLDELASARLEEGVFLKPLAKLPAKLSAAETTRLNAAYREVFGGKVLPALAKLRDFIRDEHLAHCRTSHGWSALPGGAAWYRWRAAESTTTRLTPEQIHQLGRDEVKRILGEMDQVRAQVGFKGSLAEFFVHARTHPGFYFDQPDQLFQAYAELKKKIDAALPGQFSRFPRAPYEVRPVEAFRAQSAAGAEYQQPSADGSRPGIFYVNTFNLKAQPRYGIQTLSLHEAAPGHHFQVALQQELELPRFRRFGGYTAYEEGWALYAETLGRELGLYVEPMDYYGHLSDAQLRAMRLVVDTGLHAKGWTREQAIAFMLENSSMAESDVVAEVERYMVWPGQALGYKVGQLRILALRKQAEAQLGPKFEVRGFHAAVLTDGALPMDVLEAKVQRWVDSVR